MSRVSCSAVCVCAMSMRSPEGLHAKERDDEKEKRGGIAATGSPNAFVAKPLSPSLDLLPGDLCRHQNKSRMGSHFLFPQFVPLTPTLSMMDGESLQYIFSKATQRYRVQHPSSYGTYGRKRHFWMETPWVDLMLAPILKCLRGKVEWFTLELLIYRLYMAPDA